MLERGLRRGMEAVGVVVDALGFLGPERFGSVDYVGFGGGAIIDFVVRAREGLLDGPAEAAGLVIVRRFYNEQDPSDRE